MITVTGQLKDPLGNSIPNASIRFTAITSTGSTPESSESVHLTDMTGNYDFTLAEGKYLLECDVTDFYASTDVIIIDSATPSPLTLLEAIAYSTAVVATVVIPTDPNWVSLHNNVRTGVNSTSRTKEDQLSTDDAYVNETKKLWDNSNTPAEMAENNIVTNVGSTKVTEQANAYEDTNLNQSIQLTDTGSTKNTNFLFGREVYDASNSTTTFDYINEFNTHTGTYKDSTGISNTLSLSEKEVSYGANKNSETVTLDSTSTNFTENTILTEGEYTILRTETRASDLQYVNSSNVVVSKPKGTIDNTLELTADVHYGKVFEHGSILLDVSDQLQTSYERGITTYDKTLYERQSNDGFNSLITKNPDIYNVVDDLGISVFEVNTKTKEVNINAILTTNLPDQFKGDSGDTIHEVFQYSSDNGVTDAWHTTFDVSHGDIWRRHALSTNGIVGAWSTGYNLFAEDGLDGDTIYFEYQYSSDGIAFHPIFTDGDIWRQERIITNGFPTSVWSASARIKGSDGADGEITELAYEYSIDGLAIWHGNFSTGDHYRRERVEYFYTVADRNAGTYYLALPWSAASQLVPIDGVDYGYKNSTVILYQRAANQQIAPPDPSGTLRFNFLTLAVTEVDIDALNGWSTTLPVGADSVWMAVATVWSLSDTDDIAANEWVIELLAAAGVDGVSGTYTSYIYKNAAVAPTDSPTGGTYDGITEVIPTGYTDDPETAALGQSIYVRIGKYLHDVATGAWSIDTRVHTSGWSASTQFSGTIGDTIYEIHEYSPDGLLDWNTDLRLSDYYRRQATVTNGVIGAWNTAVLIRVDGINPNVVDNGNGTYTITDGDGVSVLITDGDNAPIPTVTNNGDGTSTINDGAGNTVTVYDGETPEYGFDYFDGVSGNYISYVYKNVAKTNVAPIAPAKPTNGSFTTAGGEVIPTLPTGWTDTFVSEVDKITYVSKNAYIETIHPAVGATPMYKTWSAPVWTDAEVYVYIPEEGTDFYVTKGSFRSFVFRTATTVPSKPTTGATFNGTTEVAPQAPDVWEDNPYYTEGHITWVSSALWTHNKVLDTWSNSAWSTPTEYSKKGENAIHYYIKPLSGTAIKDGNGTLTVEAHKLDGGVDTLLTGTTDPQLYVGSTAKGQTESFNAASINGSIVVSLKDGTTVLDTITLVDVTDGLDAVYGSITSSNGLAFIQGPEINQGTGDGAWIPSAVTTDLTVTFYKKGVSVATETYRVTRATNGNLSAALTGTNNTSVVVALTGSGTSAVTLKFTYASVVVEETVVSSKGAYRGLDGDYLSYVFRNAINVPLDIDGDAAVVEKGVYNGISETPPTNWSDDPSDPPVGQTTWVSKARYYQINGQTNWTRATGWSTPSRYTGKDAWNTKSVMLYQVKTTEPAVPNNTITYTFATGLLTGSLDGWQTTVPENITEGGKVWVTFNTALSQGTTDVLSVADWPVPQVFVKNGINGIDGVSVTGEPGAHGSGSWVVKTTATKATVSGYSSATITGHFSAVGVADRAPQNQDIMGYVNDTAAEALRFRVDYLFNGTTWSQFLNVVNGDQIVHGTVAAEHITAATFTGDEFKAAFRVIAGSGSSQAGMNGATDGVYNGWRFWSGNATPSSAPFRVNSAGKLFATGADISGTVKIGVSSTELTETNTLNTNTTASNVGLGNVNNTSDATQQAATLSAATKSDVGLSSVSNVTTATIQAGTTKANVGLSNVDNTSDATVQSATLSAATKSDVGLSLVPNQTAATTQAGTTKANVGLSAVDNQSATTIQAGTTASNVGLGNVSNITTAAMRAVGAATSGTAGGWTIDSNSIYSGSKDTGGFAPAGTMTLYSGGSIHTPWFYSQASGSGFKGDISLATGTLTAAHINAANIEGDVTDLLAKASTGLGLATSDKTILSFSVSALPFDRTVVVTGAECNAVAVMNPAPAEVNFKLKTLSATVDSHTVTSLAPNPSYKTQLVCRPLAYLLPANSAESFSFTVNKYGSGATTVTHSTQKIIIQVFKDGSTIS